MGATSDNYQLVTSGTTYTIASDYVKPIGAGETAHFQIVKIAHGADNAVTYTSGSAPLPVGLCGAWGRYDYLSSSGYYSLATTLVGSVGITIPIIGVSGGTPVGVTVGTISVSSTDLDIRTLNGGAVGSGTITTEDYVKVQGICGGYPVGITFSGYMPVIVSSFTNMGVFGVNGATAVGVTFGTVDTRVLSSATDNMTVYGGGTASTVSVGLFGFNGTGVQPINSTANALNVNIASSTGITVSAADLDIRNLDYTTDTVKIVGEGAADNATTPRATVPTYINALSNQGNLLQVGGVTGSGWSAAALNVYMVNTGITFAVNANATFSAQIGVTAQYNSALPVQGSAQAAYGVWVTGSTSGDPITVKGSGAGGALTVTVNDFTTQTNTINTSVGQVKTNTDFMAAMKKALYDESVSVGAFDFADKFSIYTLVRDQVSSHLSSLTNTIIPNATAPTTQNSLAVNIVGVKQQQSFMARTGFVGFSAKSLKDFNSGAGFTCATGVRIKTARVASGASASANQFMCVQSAGDSTLYGPTAGTASYVLYHGEEMFFDVDNIDKIKVFYPTLSTSFAPSNTSTGMTFSFYAS